MSVTPEQLKALQDKVTAVVAAKGQADEATAHSNQADADAAHYAAVAAEAKLEEQTADSVLTADLADLRAYIDSLVPASVTPPVTPA